MHGFLLTRQWQERDDGGQDLIYWITTEDGPVKLVVEAEDSVFFVPESEVDRARGILGNRVSWREVALELKGVSGEPAHAFYFPSQKSLGIARSLLEQVGILALEADIRPTDRYLMERFVTGEVEVVGQFEPREGYRLCRQPRLRPGKFDPALKIASLDIETSWRRGVTFSIAVHAGEVRKVFMIGDSAECPAWLAFVPDETTLLKTFLAWFAALDPDVIIGWSVVQFDLTFLAGRCEALGIPFVLGRGGEAVRWRTVRQGGERSFATVPGRVVLDGIELLRTATYSFESFSLEFVSRSLLGRGKLVGDVDARAEEIETMFREDKQKLAEYNLEDCVLVSEIFEETNLMAFAIERCRLTGLEMDRMGGSVAAFDFLYLPRFHRAGFVAPVVRDTSGVGSPGGYVLDSKPGLYQHVIVLDFKSLYPSIIRTFHVDPLALITADQDPDPIPGFKGASFSRTAHILPGIIENLWAARDRAKQLGQGAMSQAIKIIMNSFYGVLGTPGCRFFDPRLASSITLRGHEILKKTRDLIEEQGLCVIYGDTDSVFVLLPAGVAAEEVDGMGRDLAGHLNKWWRHHLESTLAIESCLEVEYETHFSRFLMPTVRGSEVGSKKRYAGLIRDHESTRLVFKGLETVRSDWCGAARVFQQGLYERIFLDQPFEQFVQATVDGVRAGECDDALVLRRRLRRKLDEYEKNVPPHVRAARMAEEIRVARGLPPQYGSGGWVEYLMTVNGPEPKAYRTSPIDYEFYIDRQLAPIADAILSFKGATLRQITDRQMGLF
ncbi:MAG: DNA polymerase II [Pseudomonadales bacterium]|nr:DNA polymerase II [Pseudomonadales bacterium]